MNKLLAPFILSVAFSISTPGWAYQIKTTGILGLDLAVQDSSATNPTSPLQLLGGYESFVHGTTAAVDAEDYVWGIDYSQDGAGYDYQTSMSIDMTGSGDNRQYGETSGNIALPGFDSARTLTFLLSDLDWSLSSTLDSAGADRFGRYLGFTVNVFAYSNLDTTSLLLGSSAYSLSSQVFDVGALGLSSTLPEAGGYYARPGELFDTFEVDIDLKDNDYSSYTYGVTISTYMQQSVTASGTPAVGTPVPEPGIVLLIGVGFLGLLGVRRGGLA